MENHLFWCFLSKVQYRNKNQNYISNFKFQLINKTQNGILGLGFSRLDINSLSISWYWMIILSSVHVQWKLTCNGNWFWLKVDMGKAFLHNLSMVGKLINQNRKLIKTLFLSSAYSKLSNLFLKQQNSWQFWENLHSQLFVFWGIIAFSGRYLTQRGKTIISL